MKKSKNYNFLKFTAVLIFFFAAVIAILLFSPHRLIWLEKKIKSSLTEYGFNNVNLSVQRFNENGIEIRSIKIGTAEIEKLTIDYSLQELAQKRIPNIHINGASINIEKKNGEWFIADKNLSSKESKSSFPVAPLVFAGFNVGQVYIDNSIIRVIAPDWLAEILLSLQWKNDLPSQIEGRAKNVTVKAGAVSVVTEEITARSTLEVKEEKEKNEWKGNWKTGEIKISGANLDLPSLKGEGVFSVKSDNLLIQGELKSADSAIATAFRYSFSPSSGKAEIQIIDARFPWNKGILSTRGAVFSLAEAGNTKFTLDVSSVSAEELLRQLTGKQASATGSLSGNLPIEILPNGAILIHGGRLRADAPGKISLPPDSIPGDNEHLALLRSALGNFHYSLLSADINSEPDGKLSLAMKIEGKNPDVQGGRTFRLNVNLHGDVLDFVRQNVLLFLNPMHFQGKSDHE